MAIAYVDMVTHFRARGHSAAAALAYRFGICLRDSRTGTLHDYRQRETREDIAATGIEASRDTPAAATAQALADTMERAERRGDARIARDWRVSIPHELAEPDRIALAQTIACDIARRYDTVTAWAVHRPGPEGDSRNHHAHIVIPTRALADDGEFGAKLRDLDNPRTSGQEIAALRNDYAATTNQALMRAGFDERIDAGRLLEGTAVESASRQLVQEARRALGRPKRTAARDVITAAVDAGHLVDERAERIAQAHRMRQRRTRQARAPRQDRWATSRRERWRIRYDLADIGDWTTPTIDPDDYPVPAHLAERGPEAALASWPAPDHSLTDVTARAAVQPTPLSTTPAAGHAPALAVAPSPAVQPTPLPRTPAAGTALTVRAAIDRAWTSALRWTRAAGHAPALAVAPSPAVQPTPLPRTPAAGTALTVRAAIDRAWTSALRWTRAAGHAPALAVAPSPAVQPTPLPRTPAAGTALTVRAAIDRAWTSALRWTRAAGHAPALAVAPSPAVQPTPLPRTPAAGTALTVRAAIDRAWTSALRWTRAAGHAPALAVAPSPAVQPTPLPRTPAAGTALTVRAAIDRAWTSALRWTRAAAHAPALAVAPSPAVQPTPLPRTPAAGTALTVRAAIDRAWTSALRWTRAAAHAPALAVAPSPAVQPTPLPRTPAAGTALTVRAAIDRAWTSALRWTRAAAHAPALAVAPSPAVQPTPLPRTPAAGTALTVRAAIDRAWTSALRWTRAAAHAPALAVAPSPAVQPTPLPRTPAAGTALTVRAAIDRAWTSALRWTRAAAHAPALAVAPQPAAQPQPVHHGDIARHLAELERELEQKKRREAAELANQADVFIASLHEKRQAKAAIEEARRRKREQDTQAAKGTPTAPPTWKVPESLRIPMPGDPPAAKEPTPTPPTPTPPPPAESPAPRTLPPVNFNSGPNPDAVRYKLPAHLGGTKSTTSDQPQDQGRKSNRNRNDPGEGR